MVESGLDVLRKEGAKRLRGQRIGLLVHPASVDSKLRHATDLLSRSNNVRLKALFGPQHGLQGQTQDNMIEWRGFKDYKTGLPVYSLYGKVRRPTAEMLSGIDTLVIDLQDVGARYYTFTWTMLLCLQACAATSKRVVILDRPNPIGGQRRQGPSIAAGYESFVGMAAIPMRHGLTMGELAVYFDQRFDIGADLEVVWMKGWKRKLWSDETGLPWVMPSPNMPTLETATLYPGFCLLEGTNLSEGRGTTRPFEICGAPFIEPEEFAEELTGEHLVGVTFRPMFFKPTFQKWAHRLCGGVQLHVTDRDAFDSIACAVAVMLTARKLYSARFAWKRPPYEYETKILPIDILAGSPALRIAIDKGAELKSILAGWKPGLRAFERDIASHLHYG